MIGFGRLTWLVLADANRQRKKADRSGFAGGFHAETKSAGAQVAGIRETITGNVTAVPISQREPLATDKGGVQDHSARGSRYMDAAALADGGCERWRLK